MNQECWLEMDLYWFQGDSPEARAAQLFDRLAPLWQRTPGTRRGLALCVGWLFDSVLFWNGDLDAVIPTCQAPKYEPWTYRRLGALIRALKEEARRRQIDDFHVALILLAGATMSYPESAFEGWSGRTEETGEKARYDIEGRWFAEHPEVLDPRLPLFSLDAAVKVPAGENVCTREAPDFGQYFADKLCDLAPRVGLDALVLRDGSFSPSYRRGSLNGRTADPRLRREWNDSLIRTLGAIKRQRPGFILIGYDSGTSAMEEWRAHGFDLEQVAQAGVLDLWISQTWASAWQDYWPAHSMGYTFQLARVLANLAMLAQTPCKHLFLIETFDAWEPWDSIHQYPAKVAWEVWAYSHAALLRPGGQVSRSAGFYASWMNRGAELLSEETVAQMVRILNESSADLAKDPRPGGPCLVYHRAGLETLLAQPAPYCRGEAFDDWTAMLQKYGLPVLAVTRSEWLEKVEAEGLLFPVAAGLDSAACAGLEKRIRQGTPVLFMGQAALIPEPLRAGLGIRVASEPRESALPVAATVAPELAHAIGTAGLVINQRACTLEPAPDWSALIECLGGPVLARHTSLPCWVWETPEWGTPMELHLTNQSIQSPQTYVAVAASLGGRGWGAGQTAWRNLDWQKPVCFLFWRYPAGGASVLLGNLETGVTGNSQFCVKGELRGNGRVEAFNALESDRPPGKMAASDGVAKITLGAHKAARLIVGEV